MKEPCRPKPVGVAEGLADAVGVLRRVGRVAVDDDVEEGCLAIPALLSNITFDALACGLVFGWVSGTLDPILPDAGWVSDPKFVPNNELSLPKLLPRSELPNMFVSLLESVFEEVEPPNTLSGCIIISPSWLLEVNEAPVPPVFPTFPLKVSTPRCVLCENGVSSKEPAISLPKTFPPP